MPQALLFSAGKDSTALLELMRPSWNDLTVVTWLPLHAHPDISERVALVAEAVPNFRLIRANPEVWIAEHGFPSNIVPVESTTAARDAGFTPKTRVAPWTDCCAANFWDPLYATLARHGYTDIITGVKKCDGPHGNVTEPGMRWGPFTFHAPLWLWSDADVVNYLTDKPFGLLPRYTQGCRGSTACRFCSADIRGEGPSTWHWMREHDPDGHRIVADRLRAIRRAALAAL